MSKVTVKWGKEKYELVVDQNQIPLMLKQELQRLTGVDVERQKVMVKGKVLDNEDWKGVKLATGTTLMMMGQAGPVVPVEKPPENELTMNEDSGNDSDLQMSLPTGLKNLGNTCYLNATIQALKAVPEVNEALNAYNPESQSELNNHSANKSFLISLKSLFSTLDKNKAKQKAVTPMVFLNYFHQLCPQMATTTSKGSLEQQDANEAWVEICKHVLPSLKVPGNGNTSLSRFFSGSYQSTIRNLENPDEEATTTAEDFLQLSCFLAQDIKYLQSGLKNKMVEEIEKMSVTLNRNCKYEKRTLISRLPAYVTIQLVRFFYKEKGQINAKILKDVKFPMTLDLHELCTPELKKKLEPMRAAFKAEEDAFASRKKEENENMKYEKVRYDFEDDIGSNNSGLYELKAVVTHKGRYANGGHYVGWVRIENEGKGKEDKWAMCDDDEVHFVTEEQVKKLSGGGDWHCAYVLVYGPRILKKSIKE
ncbi:Ubiquitin carboxyl-terminal hydrolase [Strongyloides ratti]|uniref:Ubiquitin carboxyl-terminal hydrolase n=1 Tax=Strongyloides ratti TaxID=34506 RepID=A0A090MZR2_STRRB|nr:Ubiquitin carboxyl-terminal hydrolase [Strongyloides ratti]CEF69379.1 Ubiquitin carboxyl-terminal hydrolase [Strongyloides ratti]